MYYFTETMPRELSKLWAQVISPRPIALISTQSADGVANIAPYNSYTGLATNPPMLAVSFSLRDGGPKNTYANIKVTGEFVINLVPRFLADTMNRSAEGTEKEDDYARLGLTKVAASVVTGTRIGEAPAALECRVISTLPLPPSQCDLVVAQVVGVFLRDEFVNEDGSFDPLAADLLASVGPEQYISLNGEVLHLPRTW